jgi:hypothetical protein
MRGVLLMIDGVVRDEEISEARIGCYRTIRNSLGRGYSGLSFFSVSRWVHGEGWGG